MQHFNTAKLGALALASIMATAASAQNEGKRTDHSKEEGDRNVMLNAASANGPREIPIGLPSAGVHVLENGTGTDRAAFTDSVKVHYEGHLIPSPTYTAGYRFDASYSGTFSPVTSNPTILKISNLTDGFATAIMKMRAGDHWMVYIPFTLGYGKTKQTGSSIPAYSNLIFDLRMVGVCR